MNPAAGTAPVLPRALGLATLVLATSALALGAAHGRRYRSPAPARLATRAPGLAPGRALHGAAALLAASVLADSAIEHARAKFRNPGMATPLLVSCAALWAGLRGARAGRESPAPAGGGLAAGAFRTAIAAGIAGTAFHIHDLVARLGGISWSNLLRGAPLGAPAALSLAGVLGIAAQRSLAGRDDPRAAGRLLCAVAGAGMAGAAAEAALLHFRGAYQNPFMWLPVTVVPGTALLLGAHAAAPSPRRRRRAAAALRLSAALGLAGIGFHAWGVHRRMGGWANLRQNLMSGPPLSAPPSITALAWGALAALELAGQGGEAP